MFYEVRLVPSYQCVFQSHSHELCLQYRQQHHSKSTAVIVSRQVHQRQLTTGYQSIHQLNGSYNKYPKIRLQGRWLQQHGGFNIGDTAIVSVVDGKIIIEPRT